MGVAEQCFGKSMVQQMYRDLEFHSSNKQPQMGLVQGTVATWKGVFRTMTQ